MKKQEKSNSLFKMGLENFALALSIMYLIVIVSYAVMKGLLNYFVFIIVAVVLLYGTLWVIKNCIRKTETNY